MKKINFKRVEVSSKSDLYLCLGLKENKDPLQIKIDKNKAHTLIVGTAGIGKTNLIQGILCQLFLNYTPSTLQVAYLKDEEESKYSWVSNTKYCWSKLNTSSKILTQISNIANEVDIRLQLLNKYNYKNIKEYNDNEAEKLPWLFLVLDEINATRNETMFYDILTHIYNTGPAVGISIIRTLERVTNGRSLSLNNSHKIAFKLATRQESELLVGNKGLEKLLDENIGYGCINEEADIQTFFQTLYISNDSLETLLKD